jgi:hypothetical protein
MYGKPSMTYFNQNQVLLFDSETIMFLKPILGMETEPALDEPLNHHMQDNYPYVVVFN